MEKDKSSSEDPKVPPMWTVGKKKRVEKVFMLAIRAQEKK